MGRTYFFCKNETDFFKWCRNYVKRALYFVKSYEANKSEFSRIFEEDEYRKSVQIVRQYQILLTSLSEPQQLFLKENLIENKDYPIYHPTYSQYIKIIYDNWEQICFPHNHSKLKTIDRVQHGKTIIILRENCGLSRKKVAQLLQINDKTLSAYENGERLVKIDILYGMSQLYKTSIDLIIEKSMPVFILYSNNQ